jgi:hypothetical protein
MTTHTATSPSRSVRREQCDLADFRAIVEQPPSTFELTTQVDHGVPIYDCAVLRAEIGRTGTARRVRDELTGVLLDGPGIFVLAGAFDPAVVDRASTEFQAMIDQQHAEERAVGDHYAKPGANDRVWNAIEKLAVAAPDVFVDYYANDMVALAAEAWLGPNALASSAGSVYPRNSPGPRLTISPSQPSGTSRSSS